MAKLRAGQEAYQLTGVAKSLDDYYTGSGEASGWWAGLGAERLGLEGEVDGDDLRAVLAGLAPGSGGLSPNGDEIRSHPRRVPGFDLTFKAPKSLSVLYAVSDDPRVQGAIIESCEAAVRSTLSWLEREAIRVRRGTGNERWLADLAARDPAEAERARIRMLPGRGLTAAVFRHRTSRAGDPLLHWHALVANLVEGPDGRWSAFVHPELYRHVRAAGEVFQAAVRAEASRRLGLAWRPGRHVPEVAGVPQSLCDQFSKRAKEIEAWLASQGRNADPENRQTAVLATRRHKPEREGERFDAAWKAEALAAGWGPDAAEDLIYSLEAPSEPRAEECWRLPEWTTDADGDPIVQDRVVTVEQWVARLVSELLTKDSTFTRPDLARAVAAQLGDGATVVTVDRVMARVLASPTVVPVHDPEVARWTSVEHLAIERRFLDAVETSRDSCVPLRERKVERVIRRRRSIGKDQAEAVRSLTGSRDAVTVLVGPAGTGKTYTLDAIRAAYEADGYRVLGVAPTGRAALELEAGAHVPSSTIHRLQARWNAAYDAPDTRTLLMVDEAGMAAIRDLEPVVTRTVAAGGRVLLAGDHRQLPEIDAGGGFGAVAAGKRTTVATLRVNRRQTEPWEREALRHLRDGHVARAVDAYRTHGRVIVADDDAAMVTAGVERWFEARSMGLRPVLLGGTNEVVDALNDAVRDRLAAEGDLPREPIASSGGRGFVVGDRVVLRRTLYERPARPGQRERVFNAEAGTVVARDPAGRGVVVKLDHDGVETVLPPAYLADGHLSHGYALTTHRAQGGTWDFAIAVGTDGLYQEAGYTQLSRGKESNWLVVTRPEIDEIDEELARHDHGLPLPGEEPDVDEEIIGRLSRSRAKRLALVRDPHADRVNALAQVHHLGDLEDRAAHARIVEQRATEATGVDPKAIGEEIARAQHTATHLAVGQRVRAFDRGNIGTIIGHDDHGGTVTVYFRSPDGKEAEVEFPWADVQIVVPRDPEPRTVPPEARDCLDALVEATRQEVERWHAYLAEHGVGPMDAELYERAAQVAIDRTAAHITSSPPRWIITSLGERPIAPFAAQVWDEAIRTVAAHCARHHLPVDGPDHFGHGDECRRHGWEDVSAQLVRTRSWLDSHGPGVRPITRTRSPAEILRRRAALDAIFAKAPPDERRLINELRDSILLFGDRAKALADALARQEGRKQWILTHWPNIVEHVEITRTLTTGAAGAPVMEPLDVALDHPTGPLADAVAQGEPWLRMLIGNLADQDGRLHEEDRSLVEHVAAYRQRWHVDHVDPLGLAAADEQQAAERGRLADAIASAFSRSRHEAEPGLPFEPTSGDRDALGL